MDTSTPSKLKCVVSRPRSSSSTFPLRHGHEWAPQFQDDLQYSCVFPLPAARDCDAAQGGCDCKGVSQKVQSGSYTENDPLCQSPTDSSYSSSQQFAKVYPTPRLLQVLQGLGDQAVTASTCPKSISDPAAPTYGYNAALAGLVEQLRHQL